MVKIDLIKIWISLVSVITKMSTSPCITSFKLPSMLDIKSRNYNKNMNNK